MKNLLKDNLNIFIFITLLLLILIIASNIFDFNIHYGFFTFLRWTVTISSVGIGYKIFTRTPKSTWIILFALIAILFNPLAPIQMERDVWQVVDFVVFLIMFVYLKIQKNDNF